MTSVLDLATAPLSGADDLADRLSALEHALPEGDGVRWFCTAHLGMAMAVADAVEAAEFEDPDLVERLDIHLVREFLDQLAADARGEEVRHSWWPLFERRADGDVQPVRFALAGINAHIATDLPRAVLTTCQEAGIEPTRDSALYRDYRTINDLESEVRPSVEKHVFGPLLELADDALGSVDDAVQTFGFSAAREAAWTTADVVHELPEFVAGWHLQGLDRTTAFMNRVFLVG